MTLSNTVLPAKTGIDLPNTDPLYQLISQGISNAIDLAAAGQKSEFGLNLRKLDANGNIGTNIQEQTHIFLPEKVNITLDSSVTNYKNDVKPLREYAVVGIAGSTVSNDPAERDVLKVQLSLASYNEAIRQFISYCGPDKECRKESIYSGTVTNYPDTESTFGIAVTNRGGCGVPSAPCSCAVCP